MLQQTSCILFKLALVRDAIPLVWTAQGGLYTNPKQTQSFTCVWGCQRRLVDRRHRRALTSIDSTDVIPQAGNQVYYTPWQRPNPRDAWVARLRIYQWTEIMLQHDRTSVKVVDESYFAAKLAEGWSRELRPSCGAQSRIITVEGPRSRHNVPGPWGDFALKRQTLGPWWKQSECPTRISVRRLDPGFDIQLR